MKGPLLLVLAAGMGSRYGGLKQMDQIGQSGETLLDYSVFDALRSGFEKVIFIIRRSMEKDFHERVLNRMRGVNYELAYQELEDLIPPEIFAKAEGRIKPWGTTHAVLCAADLIKSHAFAVINADDFYGYEAFDVMGSHLSSSSITQGYIVPYNLEKTLSPKGTVARGVCEINNKHLVSVKELTAIAREESGIFNTAEDGSKEELAPDTLVSMNFWGFPRSILPSLRKYFFDFLNDPENLPKNECYLPKAVDWFIKNELLTVQVLQANADWFGVTYQEDREMAKERIARLIAKDVYPESLWA